MNPELAVHRQDRERGNRTLEITLDLADLAGIGRNDKVEVQGLAYRTIDLFERTLDLVEAVEANPDKPDSPHPAVRFVPQEKDLRSRFKFAEALGSYSTLDSLLDRYAPTYQLTRAIEESTVVAEITEREISMLEDYRDQIENALSHAGEHLNVHSVSEFSSEELRELNDILHEARDRFRAIDTLLGMRLIYDVEQSLQTLYRLNEKVQTVQRTVSGIFLVDSEIMFMPANDLIRIVNGIFKAIGNPFVVEHIDGTVLLAARNLLIHAVSFYAYYGREQIYRVFEKSQTSANRAKIAACIRSEIKTLFGACKANNKLVLTRVMDNAEREFELSVESLQIEATNQAIVAVERLMPVQTMMPKPKQRSLMQRFRRWLFRSTA